MKKNSELEKWKDAYWDYLLEHSDVTESGVLFVKFHTKNRKQFEGHVRARIDDYYHRGDPREQEEELYVTQSVRKVMKSQKKEQMRLEKEERLAKREEIKKELERVSKRNARRIFYRKILTVVKDYVVDTVKKMLHL